jgi:hypothetical protein
MTVLEFWLIGSSNAKLSGEKFYPMRMAAAATTPPPPVSLGEWQQQQYCVTWLLKAR